MASSTQDDQKGHVYSPLPQCELDDAHPHDRDQDQPSSSNYNIPVETTRATTDDDSYSDQEERGNVEPQNEKGHDYKFSALPQSEGGDDRPSQPLSISVESTRPNAEDYSEEVEVWEHVSTAGTTEMIQDLLGLTILLMLIFSPLYRRMGSPTEDPIPPVLTLNSMYVSNFSTANGTLTATWDAKLTVMNTNVSSIYFRCTDFTIFYKQNPEDALSVASLYPFYLDQGESVKLHLKFTTGGGAWDNSEPRVENWLVEKIEKDRARDESVSFGMQVNVEAIYYGDTWVSDVEMSPHCEGLKVQFVPHKGSARLTQPNRNFSIPIGWKPFFLF